METANTQRDVAPASELQVFHAVLVTNRGYRLLETFKAPTLRDACARHVALYDSRRPIRSMVLRDSVGRRYSRERSGAIAKDQS